MCDHLETRDVKIRLLPVNEHGLVDLPEFQSALGDEISLVSIQWVNNETGVIQPIEEIGSLCREAGIPFHTDAAQAVGKFEINLSATPIDYLSFTGHKFHAPQGIGILYARDINKLQPIMFGGSQENGLRPGTENLAGIAGIGCAAAIRNKQLSESVILLETLRHTFEQRLIASIPDIKINGGSAPRVCNTTNVLFDGLDGQALTVRLDQAGIRCSQSSACTNQRPEPSYVLRAMGLSEDQAYGSIRFSFSVLNTAGEVERAVEIIAELCKELRAFGV
jgi:cysteine desulfurase